ncbi:MAG: hypothetical protein LBE78_02185 [Burkholderiaceae bacterium]|jgi:3-oxoacyl-[acyl-carrier-protein] synthase-1|nr:hypothetical protein [Burkholderiaceae bacterium]
MKNSSTQEKQSLQIVSSGICCSVGYTARAASCALRAGIDHFQESNFQTSDGDVVRVGCLPNTTDWGAKRQSVWIAQAAKDCLDRAGSPKDDTLVLVALSAEPQRPGVHERKSTEAAIMSGSLLSRQLSGQSHIIHGGRAGLTPALEHVWHTLSKGLCRQVLLIGFDSFLNAQAINHYLEQDRLLVSDNSDGFLPGEAAAAVLLELGPAYSPGVHIIGWGKGEEPGRVDGSVPTRSMGMTAALRQAFKQAGVNCNDLDFRISDQNGESFFVTDAVNALTRVAEDGGSTPMVYTTADCTGEVGAATGPLMLAWLYHLLQGQDSPGDCGVIHLANDGGERSAAVVQYRS